MLQKGLASIDLSNKLEENMLHVAARDNSYNIINFLIKKNRLDIDQKNLKGQTPLCLAAKYRHYDVIKELVELGANLNVQDPMGRTALHWACDDEGIVSKSRTRDGDKIVKFLLAVDRSIPAENKKNKVLSFDDQDPYTYTNLDIKDNDGRVPLHLAVMSKRYVTLQELSDTGALLDIQDNDGNTPLHLAALQGDVSAVDILLKGGADIDVINYEHKMPLQCVTVPKVAALFVKYK
jgi:ankyrin repeat protein